MPAEKAEAPKLTDRQQDVLETLRDIGRDNAVRYRSKTPYLYQQDCEKLLKGDEACVFGLGGLTWQVGERLGLAAAAVLSTFKALEKKGLIIRETYNPRYQRPLYWWPVGLAQALADEHMPGVEVNR
ncbi:hypothetical protein HU751_023155 [Pseudomonas sp. BW13M1]|uniref:Uncharacterized protein n=1 Tax=Pseudomonas peradeniyensis TaxID=2745488 RepID=A0A923G9Q2_9PSED|nr:hypothetical protein [Pseudomonas peradeniyensis]MBV4507734.1 hypothetical protein [Pseudomonas peradeniyensis]